MKSQSTRSFAGAFCAALDRALKETRTREAGKVGRPGVGWASYTRDFAGSVLD